MLMTAHDEAMLARRLRVGLTFGDLDNLHDELFNVNELGEQLRLVSAHPPSNFFILEAVTWGIEQIHSNKLSIVLAGPLGHEEAHDFAVNFGVVTHASDFYHDSAVKTGKIFPSQVIVRAECRSRMVTCGTGGWARRLDG
jgi:hypothetical protein